MKYLFGLFSCNIQFLLSNNIDFVVSLTVTLPYNLIYFVLVKIIMYSRIYSVVM